MISDIEPLWGAIYRLAHIYTTFLQGRLCLRHFCKILFYKQVVSAGTKIALNASVLGRGVGLKIFILLAFLVMGSSLRAEFITLTSRTQGPNFTQFFTGDRYKLFAQLDTQLKLLRISAWEYGNPPEHLWHRDYPLTTQVELMEANRAMAHS